jgi:lipid II:glycine glycyltransferase (peptidoglycan interpeptide bridge formation enzyme)
MQQINAKEFYFFREEYFNALCAMKNTLQFIAVHNEQVIAATIFILQKDILEYHLSANSPLGMKLQANNLILHTAFLYAKNQNCFFAHLGGGVSAEHNDPLFLFKLSFAGKLADYKIGKYVHNVSVYDDLIAQKLCEVR